MGNQEAVWVQLDAKSTALVLIDLQNGIMGRTLAPHAAKDVIARAAKLAEAVRSKSGTAVYVRVDVSDMLHLPVDAPSRDPNAPPPPPTASELVAECGYQTGDLLITKRQWGAFYGTGLEQQLRRRGVRTIVIGGVATNFGVESTARVAYDRGFELVFVEDAMSSMSEEMHRFAVQSIFPRMGRVRSTEDVILALR
ncbi:MAG: hydrolase [Acidobacteriota bacterium]